MKLTKDEIIIGAIFSSGVIFFIFGTDRSVFGAAFTGVLGISLIIAFLLTERMKKYPQWEDEFG